MQFHLLVAENCKLGAGMLIFWLSACHADCEKPMAILCDKLRALDIFLPARERKAGMMSAYLDGPWLAIVSFSSAFITLLSMSSNTILIRARCLLEESIPEKPEPPTPRLPKG
ncbi:hypothetical protein GQ457_17G003910 [Hibiscus cannabinus]